MDFSFTEALSGLGADTLFTIANEARTPDAYLFNTILPETNVQDYKVTTGDMQISATMAGLAGESGPYPPGGHISISKFLEETAKIANQVSLQEGNLRKLQQMVIQRIVQGQATTEFLQREILNFFDKVVLQGHYDTFEWLRAQALINGEIQWNFNNKSVTVDYGVPADHFLAERTGTSAYDAAESVFWDDIRLVDQKLRYNTQWRICHIDTLMAILSNNANSIEIQDDSDGVFRLARRVGSTERISTDRRDSVTIITYDREGELIDPSDPSNTIKVPFMPKKKILNIARNQRSNYRVGEGSTDDPANDRALGYTHLGPTVEGGGVAGRWGRVRTPEERPWELVGEAVTNGLPVIETPKKLAVMSTQIDGS